MSAKTSLAEETECTSADVPQVPRTRCRSLAATAVLFAVAIAGGLAVGLLVQTWQSSGSAMATWSRFSHWALGPAPFESVANGLDRSDALPVRAARLDAAVWVAGRMHAAERGPIALPTGARFQLSASANRAGKLEVFAIDPGGVSGNEPLWSTRVNDGKAEFSPALRLDGPRGLETLRMVLWSPDGKIQEQRDVRILHL